MYIHTHTHIFVCVSEWVCASPREGRTRGRTTGSIYIRIHGVLIVPFIASISLGFRV